MIDEILNWASALGTQGWIAVGLTITFFLVIIVTIFLLWQLKSSHLNSKPKAEQTTTKEPSMSALDEATESNKKSASLFEEAEVFIDYGLKQQAIDALTRHLRAEPKDKKAQKLLKKISQS